MVGQTPAEQKNVSPQMTIVCTRRGKYNLGRTYISLTGFLSLISGQKDCLTSLRCLNLASLGQTTAPLCQTSFLPPYDLGKKSPIAEKKVRPCLFSSTGHIMSLGRNIYSTLLTPFSTLLTVLVLQDGRCQVSSLLIKKNFPINDRVLPEARPEPAIDQL